MQEELAYRLSEGIAAFCRANMYQRSKLPIRSSEMGILIFISLHAGVDGVRAVELSEYFGIRKSSVSAVIAALEKQGYIKRTSQATDKRSSPLFITEKGARLVGEALQEYNKYSNRLIEEIGPEKCEEFLQVLHRATKIIQNGEVGE